MIYILLIVLSVFPYSLTAEGSGAKRKLEDYLKSLESDDSFNIAAEGDEVPEQDEDGEENRPTQRRRVAEEVYYDVERTNVPGDPTFFNGPTPQQNENDEGLTSEEAFRTAFIAGVEGLVEVMVLGNEPPVDTVLTLPRTPVQIGTLAAALQTPEAENAGEGSRRNGISNLSRALFH